MATSTWAFLKISYQPQTLEQLMQGVEELPVESTREQSRLEYVDTTLSTASSTMHKNLMDTCGVDPNSASYEVLQRVGFPPGTARNIEKYRIAGGQYFAVKDLRKIYSMDDSLLSSVAQCLLFPEKPKVGRRARGNYTKRSEPQKGESKNVNPTILKVLDINTADSSQLVQIPGIGPYFAKSIVNRREELGGYVRMEQLMEIYLMDSSRFASISLYLTLENKSIRYININSISPNELARHPYIDFKMARRICSYRQQHGPFTKPEDLLNIYGVQEIWLAKVQEYVSFI